MTNVFVPETINGNPVSILKHFQEMERNLGTKIIKSLNRVSENSIIGRAKKEHDKDKVEEPEKTEETVEEEKPTDLTQPNLFEEEPRHHNSYDWYRKAKKFAKSLK